MLDLKKLGGEYAALSYLVTCAKRAREVLRRAMVSEQTFSDAACRAAFLALMHEKTSDAALLLAVAKREIPEIEPDDAADEFLGLSANPAALEHDAVALSQTFIMRENSAALRQLLMRGVSGDPEFLLESQRRAIEEAQAKIAALRSKFSLNPAFDVPESAAHEPVDESLLHVPGFVDALTDYSMRTAQRPNRTLSFAGALAMLAHLAARKFVGPNDSRPNIYLVALADSGVGKEWPRKVNRRVALAEGVQFSVQGDISSGQGLEDALLRTPALLMQMDEFDTLLNVMKDEKASKVATEAMWKVMLSLFSSSGSTYTTRLKAVSARGGGGGEVVYNPSLSIFATAIPAKFYASLCERALDNGFLARCLVMEAGERGEYNPDSGMTGEDLPAPLARMLRNLSNLGRRSCDNVEIDPRDVTTVQHGEGAADEMLRVNREADALYKKAKREQDGMAMSVWNRSLELVGKLALLYAISEGAEATYGFAISREAVVWAWRLVKSLQLRMLAMVADNTSANPMDEKLQKALRFIRKAGMKGIARAVLLKKAHLSSREIDEVESTLLDRDEITVSVLPRSTNGKVAKLYIAIK